MKDAVDPISSWVPADLPGDKPVAGQDPPQPGARFAPPSSGQIKGASVRGGVLTIAGQGLSFCIQTASIMVLARLLTPADYGVNGMVAAVTGILGMFTDIGLGGATIQRQGITNEQLSTLFWINLAVGCLLTMLTMAIAPGLVFFYKDSRLFWVTIVASLSFVLNGAGVQHAALLMRSMRYRALTTIGILTLTLSSALGVGMAAAGFRYWSLVAMGVSGTLVRVAGYWVVLRWRPGVPVRGCGIRSLIHFGGKATLNNLVVYVSYNAEKVLLGRSFGAGPLGLYGRAYQLLNLPLQQLHAAMYSVALPALSAMQDNSERLCRAFLKGYAVTLAVTLPIAMVSAIFAEEIVKIVLGSKWDQAVPIMRFLAPTILVFAMINPFAWFLYAIGRVGRSLKMALVIAPVVILGIVLGLRGGPTGVALGYSLAMCLLVVPLILWAIHDTGISASEYWKVAQKPLIAGLLASGCGLGLKVILAGVLNPVLLFSIDLGICAAIYVWTLAFPMRQKELYLDLLHQIMQRFKSQTQEKAA